MTPKIKIAQTHSSHTMSMGINEKEPNVIENVKLFSITHFTMILTNKKAIDIKNEVVNKFFGHLIGDDKAIAQVKINHILEKCSA